MSLIHLARQGFITKSALPNVTRQRGTTTGTANLMLYGAGKDHSIGTNTTFTDSSTNAFTVTRNGDTIQATNNPFTGSVYFDGNGDWLDVPSSANLAFGTGDYTVEFWVFHTVSGATERYIHTTTNGFGLAKNTSNQVQLVQSGIAVRLTTTTALAINTWNHIAVVRSGTTATIYINGVSSASGTVADNYAQSAITIGKNFSLAQDYLSGYLTNIRMVKGTAVYTANFAVPTSPLTAITNTQLLLLTAQQAPFRDSSSNNFTVTANGNAAGSGLEPFPVNYAGSAYFDGTGDYLSVANNTALQPGTGVFTIEAWIYRNASGAAHTIYAKGGASTGFVLQVTATNVLRFIDTTTNIDSTGTISATTWTHVAVVRSGTGTNETKLYINGTQDGQGTVTTDFNQTEEVRVGTNRSAAENFAGYISNCRFVKGTAVYTANFTPPSAPLTAVTNTSLLLLTNNVGPFVDTSANGFPILRNGDAVQTGFSPFTGQPSAGAAYFDGTGDYLTVPNFSALQLTNSTAFTIECWVYPTSLTSPSKYIFENFNSSSPFQGYGLAYNINSTNAVEWWDGGGTWANTGITLTTNEWTHIAVTYEGSGTTRRFFKNGVLSGSAGTVSSSINYTAGACSIGAQEAGNSPWFGYISNLRVIKGTALYTSNFTPSTAPLPAVPNTSLLLNTDNYTIANSTPTYLPVTVNGNTTVSTAQYPTGMNRSIYFDGTGDYLSLAANAAFDFGTGDFTIEAWVYLTTGGSYRRIYSLYGSAGFVQVTLRTENTNTIRFFTTTSGIDFTSTTTLPLNSWNHLAVVRNGSAFNLYLNGVSIASATSSAAMPATSTLPSQISGYDSSNEMWLGYISNLRIVKGSALYTANFTPPSLPLPISVTVPAYVTNNIYGVYQLA